MLHRNKNKQRLLAICKRVCFEKMTPQQIAEFDKFPYAFNDSEITDDYILGTQEFAMMLVETYYASGMQDHAVTVSIFASTILYHWWITNVRDNDFKNVTELEV